jgi:hypothetical protein
VLDNVDGRSAVARRYRDVLNELISDLGGDPSGAQSAIARRAAALCVVCEQAEAEMVAGGVLDLAEFTTAANSLRRLLSDLGLERRARDITPTHQWTRQARGEPSREPTNPHSRGNTMSKSKPSRPAPSPTHKPSRPEPVVHREPFEKSAHPPHKPFIPRKPNK